MSGERERTASGRLSDDARAAFAERVLRVLGPEQALTGSAAAPYSPRGQTPAVVARPAYLEGVRAAVALSFEAGAAVAPWGSGSRQALGYPPERCDLVISLERLTRVVAYDPADLTITVEAGMTHAALAEHLAKTRQSLPLDPPLPARATIGGTLATAISGLRGARYGDPRDLVLGLRVVDASGQMVRAGGAVVKNSTGYGMRRLYTGSLGALGVITEACFKLIPLPETEATVIAACDTAQQVWEAALQASQLATRPAAVAALPAAALPELARLAPRHLDEALLAVRLPGVGAAVARAAASLERTLSDTGARPLLTLDAAATGAFWASVNDFPALRTAPREALARASTLPSETMPALDFAQRLASEHHLTLHWLADLQAGTLWLRLSDPDSASDATGPTFASALRAALAAFTHRWSQTILLACPDAYAEDIPIWGAEPETLPLMREIKRRFDPSHLLNPGRLAGRL
jgi:glycolate oxidase FAD binding subunit